VSEGGRGEEGGERMEGGWKGGEGGGRGVGERRRGRRGDGEVGNATGHNNVSPTFHLSAESYFSPLTILVCLLDLSNLFVGTGAQDFNDALFTSSWSTDSTAQAFGIIECLI